MEERKYFFDERANDEQRDVLNMIFTGKAGGFMAEFAKLIGHVHGVEYVPIKFELQMILVIGELRYQGR